MTGRRAQTVKGATFRCSRSSGWNRRCQSPRRQTWQASAGSPRCPPGTLRRRSSIDSGVPSRAKWESGGSGEAWPRGVERLELRHEFRPGSGSTNTRHRSGKGQSRTLRGGDQLNRFGKALNCCFSSIVPPVVLLWQDGFVVFTAVAPVISLAGWLFVLAGAAPYGATRSGL